MIKKYIAKHWLEISFITLSTASLILVYNLDSWFEFTFEKKYSVASLTAIPLFVITVIHIYWGVLQNRKSFVNSIKNSNKSLERAVIDQK